MREYFIVDDFKIAKKMSDILHMGYYIITNDDNKVMYSFNRIDGVVDIYNEIVKTLLKR